MLADTGVGSDTGVELANASVGAGGADTGADEDATQTARSSKENMMCDHELKGFKRRVG